MHAGAITISQQREHARHTAAAGSGNGVCGGRVQLPTMISQEHHCRRVGDAARVQRVQQPSDLAVDEGDTGEILEPERRHRGVRERLSKVGCDIFPALVPCDWGGSCGPVRIRGRRHHLRAVLVPGVMLVHDICRVEPRQVWLHVAVRDEEGLG